MSQDQFEVSLYDEGLLKHVCLKCNFIFDHSGELAQCTNCGKNRKRFFEFSFFPSIEAVDILYSIFELKKHAENNQKEIIIQIRKKLKDSLNNEYDFSKIDALLVESISIMNDPKGYEIDSERRDKSIKTKLDLENNEHIQKANDIVFNGDNINRLYKSIVILSASLIEIIFKEYMFKVIEDRTNKLTSQKMAEMLNHQTVEGHLTQLNVFFDNGFRANLDCHQKIFFDKWTSLRKLERNKLIHKNSIYISSKRVNEVFEMAKESINIFSQMTNTLLKGASSKSS